MSEADSIRPRAAARDEGVERGLGAVLGHRRTAGAGRARSRAARRRAPTGRGCSRCSAVAHCARISFSSGSAASRVWPSFVALDQRRHLDQLEVARHRLVHVQVGVEPHLAQVAADAGHGVEQLVAHQAEGGVEALGRAEQLLLEHLLLDAHRRARLLVEGRGRAAWRRADRSRPRRATSPLRARVIATCSRRRISASCSARGRPRPAASPSASSSGTSSARARRGAGHARCGQPEHEHVVELEPLGGVHGHDLHGGCAGRVPRASSSRSPDSATAVR